MLKRMGAFFITLFVIGLSFIFLNHNPSYGFDTELYTVTGVEVPPNVLFIFDNSSSMANEDQAPPYNIDRTNPPPTYSGSYPMNAVYKKSGNDWVLYKDDYNQILCSAVRDALAIDGIYNGKLKSDTNCDTKGSPVFLQTGNYMNYLLLTQTSNQPRLGLAKGTIHSYVNSTEGIRFGLMIFNANGQGGRISAQISDDKNAVFNALSDIQTSNLVDWTPLSEALYEAMLYFKGDASYYNSGTTYTSPIQYRCQKNYIIIITDGAPTYDVADDNTSPIPSVIGDYDGDGNDPGSYSLYGSHYLDDVAKYVHLNDLRGDLAGRQNITVYTIGFNPSQLSLDTTLLQSTASKGGGQYHYAHNAQTFKAALQSVIEEILAKSVSFVAPTVPISQMEKTASVDRMYLGMFKPSENAFWKGNIKKFGIAATDDPLKGISIGDILDKNGNPAIDTLTGGIYDTSISYWSISEDGGDVEKGGVGEILKNMTNLYDRKIYTYLGNANLTDSSNAFTTTNTGITPGTLGLTTEDDKNKLINFLYGYDSYDENGNSNTTEKRSWILGAIIHSRPLVIHHSTKTVIYAGANDGMLHAFDDSNGNELWAFIPPDLLPKLQNLTGNTLEFFVDGTPKAYEGSSQKILIFGERRGGNRYYALDITNPDSPQLLWQIYPAGDYSEMGQTWSTPGLSKIKYGTADSWVDKWVFFIGGGYDTNQDNLPVVSNDSMGRAVYVIDVLNGSLIKQWKYSATDNPEMKYSIPSDIGRVDTDLDGRIDRLYVGDTGGQIWRFDIGLDEINPSPTNWSAKRIFNANDPAPSPGVDRRKIFYPPDVALEKDSGGNYELVIFGTGDREHPKDTTVYNRLYTVKDRNSSSVLKEADLEDVTLDLLQTGTSEQKQTTSTNLNNKSGWYIILSTNSGEKCLAPPLLFYGISYYTTFTPQSGSISDPCFIGEGYATLYAVGYLTGTAYFNFDLLNDVGGTTLGASDRSTIIGAAIPSGAIIAVVGGSSATGYIGIGGGIYKAPLKSTKVLVPISWKQQF